MCYWKNNEYYGFGLGASSYLNNCRYSNTRSITNYKNNIVLDIEFVDLDSKIEYEILLGLRLIDGIDLDLFKKRFNKELIELYDYNILINQGLLCIKNRHLFIPEDKLYVSNEIIVKLIQNKK
jgi:oxygen-independent coproporphyrinogen-3 oxidase